MWPKLCQFVPISRKSIRITHDVIYNIAIEMAPRSVKKISEFSQREKSAKNQYYSEHDKNIIFWYTVIFCRRAVERHKAHLLR